MNGFEVNVHDGFSYLVYNELLKEIGHRYTVLSKTGGTRCLTPSEVDIALYQYDKERINKQNTVPNEKRKRTAVTH